MQWLPEIREIMASVMMVSPDAIRAETSPEDLPAWDSLTHLNLVVAIEMQFRIRLGSAEIERMVSVGDICGIVAGKLGA